MNFFIKKYIKCELQKNIFEKVYEEIFFRGDCSLDLKYLLLILFTMDINKLINCINNNNYTGWQNETVMFDVENDEIEITYLWNISSGSIFCSPDFILKKKDFENIIYNYKSYYDELSSHFYLILLSDNRIFLQKELNSNNLKASLKYIEFVKFAYIKTESWYKPIEITSNNLSSFYSLQFALNDKKVCFEKYGNLDHKDIYPEDISFEIISKIIEEWNLLKSEEQPVYFVKEDDGSITVRKTILDLKYLKLEINESGEYHVADEYGIEVFDFLEEFAIGFNPEKWFAEFEHAITEDSGYQVHHNVEILYSIKEHFVLLRLGKAPQEYEYIERDRAQYKEDRDVLMPLDDFQNLMQQWINLKREKTPEIWFRQRENRSIVINIVF